MGCNTTNTNPVACRSSSTVWVINDSWKVIKKKTQDHGCTKRTAMLMVMLKLRILEWRWSWSIAPNPVCLAVSLMRERCKDVWMSSSFQARDRMNEAIGEGCVLFVSLSGLSRDGVPRKMTEKGNKREMGRGSPAAAPAWEHASEFAGRRTFPIGCARCNIGRDSYIGGELRGLMY